MVEQTELGIAKPELSGPEQLFLRNLQNEINTGHEHTVGSFLQANSAIIQANPNLLRQPIPGNRAGDTPMHLALALAIPTRDIKIMKVLESNGASIDAPNADNLTVRQIIDEEVLGVMPKAIRDLIAPTAPKKPLLKSENHTVAVDHSDTTDTTPAHR